MSVATLITSFDERLPSVRDQDEMLACFGVRARSSDVFHHGVRWVPFSPHHPLRVQVE